ncbi:hypothetical protein BK666_22850 [Pseudomonas frederiksbergensis]|uniref:Uncharacterized protein n=1 Tax=Pseudomonas frederiksbergensis TaxID=104087 RepID=A0A423JY39_9PSED|nr:hypothetical protein [Pseudomonas frederiksbergensis]RON42582.1 hypothetical protein BK666_22850 [Pseudomonas frederiksbergensis]
MKIAILKIIELTDLGAYVEFSSPYGIGLSFFVGSDLQENQTHDIELSIDDNFVWGDNIKLSDKTSPSIGYLSKELSITAEIIAIEDDDCSALRIGSSITLISVDKKNHPLPFFVDLTAGETSLYRTNI